MSRKSSTFGLDASGVERSAAVNANNQIEVRIGASVYGAPPETWYLPWTGTNGAADNAVIYTSPDVSMYNYHTIKVSGTNSADVQVTLDGTNWTTAVAVELADNVTTGGGVKVLSIPTGKVGVLRGKFRGIRVLQDGTTNANATGAHSVI